jgi:hypothetical protein
MRAGLFMLTLLFTAPLMAAKPTDGSDPAMAGQSPGGPWSDPMRPPAFALGKYRQEKLRQQSRPAGDNKPSGRRPSWVLSSILFAPGRQRAIVNGRLLAVGDRVDGARLTAIERDRVRLSIQGRTITLKLGTRRLDLKKTRTR